jgi:hypothetical protein
MENPTLNRTLDSLFDVESTCSGLPRADSLASLSGIGTGGFDTFNLLGTSSLYGAGLFNTLGAEYFGVNDSTFTSYDWSSGANFSATTTDGTFGTDWLLWYFDGANQAYQWVPVNGTTTYTLDVSNGSPSSVPEPAMAFPVGALLGAGALIRRRFRRA